MVVFIVDGFLKQVFKSLKVEQVEAGFGYTFINCTFFVFVRAFFLHVFHDDARLFHHALVSIDFTAFAHGDGDGIRRPCIHHGEVVALFAHQHGVIDAVAETVDDHLHDFDAELVGESDEKVVGVGATVFVFFNAHGNGLGLGTPDDDGQTALRVLVAQNQDVCPCRGFAVGQADDFQTDFVHFCSF